MNRADRDSVAGLLRRATQRLTAAGVREARSDARLLLQAATGLSRSDLLTAPARLVDEAGAGRFALLVDRRARREPIAYILGEREFWGLPFAVGPGVLIPRPETETLIEAALASVPDRAAALRILDLGVGSGCLLLTLLQLYPAATGAGVDSSAAALRVAAHNAQRLELTARAALAQGGWDRAPHGPFDLIVSNPPYVAAAELHRLEPELRDHEPRAALDGGPDGLDAYRGLLPAAADRLAPSGVLVLEIGHSQADRVAALAHDAGLTVTARRRDLAGVERCLVARGDARRR